MAQKKISLECYFFLRVLKTDKVKEVREVCLLILQIFSENEPKKEKQPENYSAFSDQKSNKVVKKTNSNKINENIKNNNVNKNSFNENNNDNNYQNSEKKNKKDENKTIIENNRKNEFNDGIEREREREREEEGEREREREREKERRRK